MKQTEIKKLKVAELKARLQERSLSTKGLKAELVERLLSAIEAESHVTEADNTEEDGASVEVGNDVNVNLPAAISEEGQMVTIPTAGEEGHIQVATGGVTQLEESVDAARSMTSSPDCIPLQANHTWAQSAAQLEVPSSDDVLSKARVDRLFSQPIPSDVTAATEADQSVTVKPEVSVLETIVVEHPQQQYVHRSPAQTLVKINKAAPPLPTCVTERASSSTSALKTNSSASNGPTAGASGDNGVARGSPVVHIEGDDHGQVAEPASEDQMSDDLSSQESRLTVRDVQGDRAGVKRPLGERGRSYYEFKEEIQYNRAKTSEPEAENENGGELDEALAGLDAYNSDLHFEVGPDGGSGQPLFWEKFPLLQSGCRLTHGVCQGRVGFEAKFVKRLSAPGLDHLDPDPHVLRVGWSVDNSSLQLGEVDLSYGFDGRGRKVTGGHEEDFGTPFSEGDVIGCYAFISDGEAVELSFHKNGLALGVAFRLSPSVLGNQALYPHVLCKNCSVTLNLDPAGTPWHPGLPGHRPLHTLPPHERVRAPLPPATKTDCEVLMMVGMPGAGKTHWAQTHIAQNPEKRFNLLSTSAVLRCMAGVSGPGQRERLLQQASQCLSQLIRVAAGRRRNYILDQVNVYPSARVHKLLRFRGYRRRAVVVVPSDEEWQRRLRQQQHDEGEVVPQTSLLKVKASFTLPEQGDLLEEVLFAELSREEVDNLLVSYKVEARQLLPSPPKRKKPRNRRNKPFPPGPNQWNGGHGWNQGAYAQQPYWGPQQRHDHHLYGRFGAEFGRFYGYNSDPQRYRDYYQPYAGQWNSCYGNQSYQANRNYSHQGFW